MKTRKEILEAHHDSALAKRLESEINLEALRQREEGVKPGAEYDKLQEAIEAKVISIERIDTVLKIIEDKVKK